MALSPDSLPARLLRHRTASIGLFICLVVLAAVVAGPLLLPYGPEDMDFMAVLSPPSLAHPLGTDSFGRDVLVRVMAGGQVSLTISFCAIALASALGCALGTLAGYHGGWTDLVIMRVMDLLFAFPSFILALLLMVLFGFSTQNIIFAIALVYLPIFARIARNSTALVRSEPYVEAARLIGAAPGGHHRDADPAQYLSPASGAGLGRPCLRDYPGGRPQLHRPRRSAADPFAGRHHGRRAGIFQPWSLGSHPQRRSDFTGAAGD